MAIFTQNDSVSQVVKECCEKVLNKDGTTNIVVYSDSAGYYADEGLSYRELLLKRLSSGTADDLYLIHAEDVLEFLYGGASAVEVGMQNFIDPLCCVKIIEDLPKVLKKYGNNSLNDAVGRSFR